jgi:oxygen-dependent protoporphyrinogen oxidase
MSDRPHVVVVGGGITGLSAAHTLLAGDDPPDVSLFEAGGRLGGNISATSFAGLPRVDCGADMFLARTPTAVDLAADLGLADELVAPAPLPAHVWSGGRLHRIPDGVVLGAPAAVWPLARSHLLSWRGKARAVVEPLLPRDDAGDALGALIRRRFGDEVLERLVGPLIGGINAGDPDRLSLRAVTPQLAEASEGHRSLLLGLRAQARRARRDRSGAGDQRPTFLAPRSGMASLVDRLGTVVQARGCRVHLGCAATSITLRPGRRWTVQGGDVLELDVDEVILATPAPMTARLLDEVDADVAFALRTIAYASVAIVTLAVRDEDIVRPVAGSGYLVARAEQRTITACSWGSAKWEQWRRPGQTVLRASVGREGDERALDLDDAGLIRAVLDDLDLHVGLSGEPVASRVSRWPAAMPQYAPGHLERIDDAVTRLARTGPGLHLAGAAYKGLGIPACIAQGQAAARAALATFGRR